MGKEGHLGELEQVLLLAIMQLDDEAYGVRIMSELEERIGRRVSRGSVYVTLDRLEEKELIVSESAPARSGRGGRPRRIVRVTPEGVDALRRSRAALMSMWHGLEEALEG